MEKKSDLIKERDTLDYILNYVKLPEYGFVLERMSSRILRVKKGQTENNYLDTEILMPKDKSPLEIISELNNNAGIDDAMKQAFVQGYETYWGDDFLKFIPLLKSMIEDVEKKIVECERKEKEMAEEVKENKEEKKTVWIKVHKSFARLDVEKREVDEDGKPKTFNIITLPKGVKIDDKDVGGYKFNPKVAWVDKKNENEINIPFNEDTEIWLKESFDKRKEENKDREPVIIKVSPEKLNQAIRENHKEYQKEHGKEAVWININKQFVRENIAFKDKNGNDKTFNSVTMPPGTVIDGKDVSGYQCNPNIIRQDQKFEKNVAIPYKAGAEIKLKENLDMRKEENQGKEPEVVIVTPEKIKEAFKENRERYKASLGDKLDSAEKTADKFNESIDKPEKSQEQER